MGKEGLSSGDCTAENPPAPPQSLGVKASMTRAYEILHVASLPFNQAHYSPPFSIQPLWLHPGLQSIPDILWTQGVSIPVLSAGVPSSQIAPCSVSVFLRFLPQYCPCSSHCYHPIQCTCHPFFLSLTSLFLPALYFSLQVTWFIMLYNTFDRGFGFGFGFCFVLFLYTP